MSKERSNGWTPEQDAILTQIVLEEVAKGKTQIMAFKRAGRVLERTPGACGFRFNNTIRPSFEQELKEAVRKGRFYKREIPSIPVPPATSPVTEAEREEAVEEVKEQLLSWEKLLAERETKLQDMDASLLPDVPVGDVRYNEPKVEPTALEEDVTKVIDETEIYRRARTAINMAQRRQVAYGMQKYPNPLNADTWSTIETIDHIIDESIDKLHYLVMLRIKLEQQGE